MTKLRFDDGVEFDTDGPYRIEHRADGWYVVGKGLLCPCDSQEEAQALIDELEGKR